MNKLIDIDASACTNRGLVRRNNEDNFYLNGSYMHEQDRNSPVHITVQESNREFIYAVCDGMGGEAEGEKASITAVSELKSFHEHVVMNTSYDNINSLINLMNDYIGRINHSIYDLSCQGGALMGTTLASLLIYENQAAALNTGDSRVYLQRDGTMKLLTTDHTEAERLIRLGSLNRNEAKGHRSRHQLYRYLGTPPDNGKLEADVSEIIRIKPSDIFLICSDGLTDMLEEGRISEILSQRGTAGDKALALVKDALDNGGADNVTSLVIKIEAIRY